jgi:hypothetical protein
MVVLVVVLDQTVAELFLEAMEIPHLHRHLKVIMVAVEMP